MANFQTAIPAQDEGGRACKNGHRGCCRLLHGRDVQVLPGRDYRKVCASFTFRAGVFGRWELFFSFQLTMLSAGHRHRHRHDQHGQAGSAAVL